MKSPTQILALFHKKYRKVPGILEVQRGLSRKASIIVFYDSNKLKTNIPREFNDALVHMYDVREMLYVSNRVLEKAKEHPQASGHAYVYFHKTAELCNKLLSKSKK